MFKQHQAYVQARNRLNLAEEEHRDTLETINDKLNDSEFLATAISGPPPALKAPAPQVPSVAS
jgi:hypothetical protein